MKTNIFIFCFLLANIAFFSCDDGDDIVYAPTQFHGVISQFEGDESNSNWAENDEVGVYMVPKGEELVAENILSGADNKKFVYDINGNLIPQGEEMYYPTDGSNVDFYAYFPYNPSTSNGVYPVDVSGQSDQKSIDLMRAAIKNKTQEDAIINIKFGFHHTLAKIKINIEKDMDIADLDVSGIQLMIEGMPTTADFNIGTEIFSNKENVSPIEMRSVEAGVAYDALVIPTTANSFTGRKITVTAPEELELEPAFYEIPDGLALVSGNSYEFPITLYKKGATKIVYNVGDYYPDPNVDLNDPEAKAQIEGVVFWVDPISEGRHGLVMNLKDVNTSGYAPGTWGARWGVDDVFETNLIPSMASEDDGKTATKDLIAAHKDEADFSTNYALFDYVYTFLNNGDIDGVWYMPSFNELRRMMAFSFGIDYDEVLADWDEAIRTSAGLDVIPTIQLEANTPVGASLEARTLVNQKLEAAGGSKVPDDRGHASTTELDKDASKNYVGFKGVISRNGRLYKSRKNLCQFRAIRQF
ncbi:fimbrillin family protein [Thermophagus sp. OGC60D27]|uniref:fimbrillin family protein n=1 Tax=Thermophagus sp. OGC60D27 TaxID=3458415 RepID=UPI0040380A73